MSDPLDVLRTYEKATPGPWLTDGNSPNGGYDVMASQPEGWDRMVATCDRVGSADAHHIATWDPETCREVVEILQRFRAAVVGEVGPRNPNVMRLDALLVRIRETPGQ